MSESKTACVVCGFMCTGRTCSGACRAKLSRRTRTDEAHGDERTVEAHAQQGGTIATPDKRSSSTGDPRDTESGEKTIVTDFPHKVVDPRPIEDQPPYQVDPRESGMERAIAASAKLVADDANPPTSRCFQDSGIPLPGDPGYRGVCALHHESKRWLLHPKRLRLTRAEMQKRHAHV